MGQTCMDFTGYKIVLPETVSIKWALYVTEEVYNSNGSLVGIVKKEEDKKTGEWFAFVVRDGLAIFMTVPMAWIEPA